MNPIVHGMPIHTGSQETTWWWDWIECIQYRLKWSTFRSEENKRRSKPKFISLVPAKFYHKVSAKIENRHMNQIHGKMSAMLRKWNFRSQSMRSSVLLKILRENRLIAVKSTRTAKMLSIRFKQRKWSDYSCRKFPEDFKCLPDAEAAVRKFQKQKQRYFISLILFQSRRKEISWA